MGSSDILDFLADTCDQQAGLFLDCPPDDLDEASWLDASRAFSADARDWNDRNGDTDPAGWISRVVVSYLSEASHQLAGLAVLVRSRAVHTTLDPLVRAVLERCGRVCWLIDHEANCHQRAARAQLELGVCALYYAETLALLEGPKADRTKLREWRGEHRARVHTRHTVDTKGERKDMSAWVVDGEAYPGYSETVAYALGSHPRSAGVYAGLSGFAHPNVFFAAERRHQTTTTRNFMVMHTDSIEKNLRIALAAHLAAAKHWAAYFLDQELADAVAAAGDRLADALDAASGLDDLIPVSQP